MQVKERAVELAKAMENEDGVTGAVKAFYKHFPGKKTEPEPDNLHHPRSRSLFSVRRCFGCSWNGDVHLVIFMFYLSVDLVWNSIRSGEYDCSLCVNVWIRIKVVCVTAKVSCFCNTKLFQLVKIKTWNLIWIQKFMVVSNNYRDWVARTRGGT